MGMAACHSILYTVANGGRYADGEPDAETPVWRTAMYVVWGVVAVLAIVLEVLTIMRYLKRRKAVAAPVSGK